MRTNQENVIDNPGEFGGAIAVEARSDLILAAYSHPEHTIDYDVVLAGEIDERLTASYRLVQWGMLDPIDNGRLVLTVRGERFARGIIALSGLEG